MKTVLRILFVLAILVMVVPAASAQLAPADYTGPDNQNGTEPCAGTMNPDDCMFGVSSTSGVLYYCAAKGSWNQSCADLVTVGGTPVCANVKYEAHCQCDTSKSPATSGFCTYYN